MKKEQLFIVINRIVLGVVLLVEFIILIALLVPPEDDPYTIVEHSASVVKDYTFSTTSDVRITAKFNQDLNSGRVEIEVKFYDEDDNYLGTETGVAYASNIKDDTATFDFSDIEGVVEQYEIVDYSVTYYSSNFNIGTIIVIFVLIITLSVFISALFLRYRVYDVGGTKVAVYVGHIYTRLKVSDKEVDSRAVFSRIVPTRLTTTLQDETKIEAIVSAFSKITFKANDQLLTPEKWSWHK